MATILFKGDPEQGGIPYKANVRIESMSVSGSKIRRRAVFVGKVSSSLSIDLDPGKYVYSVTKLLPEGEPDNCCYVGEFYEGVTPDQWKSLQYMNPRMVRVMHTSEGVRWDCQFPACRVNTTSAIGALMHEIEHFGISREEFLANPKALIVRNARIRATEVTKVAEDQKVKKGKQLPLGEVTRVGLKRQRPGRV